MTKKPGRENLKVRLYRDQIVISIGIETLSYAIEWAPGLEKYDEKTGDFLRPRITNAKKFASEMVTALHAEDEEGSTMVHKMLDAAALEAIEQGAEGIELAEDQLLTEQKS